MSDRPAPPATDTAEIAAGAEEVVVGFYTVTLQGLDQHDSSYFADFYM